MFIIIKFTPPRAAPTAQPAPLIEGLTFGKPEHGESQIRPRSSRWPGFQSRAGVFLVSGGLHTGELVFGSGNRAAMSMCREYPRWYREDLWKPLLIHEGIIEPSWRVTTVDCRFLTDPESREHNRHCGYHPTIIQQFVRHWRFPGWLNGVMSKINEGLSTEDPQDATLAVVFWCRAGNHRSVAAAAVVQHLLQATCMPVRLLGPPHHCSRRVWRERLCDMCATCVQPHPARHAALRQARQVWRALAQEEIER